MAQRKGSPLHCPVCAHALVSFCPRCRGAAGGRAMTPEKREIFRQGAQKARDAAKAARMLKAREGTR